MSVPVKIDKPARVTQIETGIEAEKNKEAQNESEHTWKIVSALCVVLVAIDSILIYGIYSGRIKIEKRHGDSDEGIHQP